jgi:hypothetical protein
VNALFYHFRSRFTLLFNRKTMLVTTLLIVIATPSAILLLLTNHSSAMIDPVQYVNPLIGTEAGAINHRLDGGLMAAMSSLEQAILTGWFSGVLTRQMIPEATVITSR